MPESCHVFAMEPEPFRAVTLGLKTAVVLPISLGVFIADQLVFREWREESEAFTGNWLCRRVTHEERSFEATMSRTKTNVEQVSLDRRLAVYSMNTASENDSARAYYAHRMTRAKGEGTTQDQFWEDEGKRESARRGILRSVG